MDGKGQGREQDCDNSREEMKEKWEEICSGTSSPHRNLTHILDKLHHDIILLGDVTEGRESLGRFSTWFSRIAAILILPVLVTSIYFHHEWNELRGNQESWAEIYSPSGARTKFMLPDGSTGFLNGDSRIKYPMNFQKNRHVELVGEAYFDVVHNENRPFVVAIDDLRVKVLGTQFNVIAYDHEGEAEVILESGSVELMSVNNNATVMMKPDEQVIYSKKTGIIRKQAVNASRFTSWKDGRLEFRNVRFTDVAKRLSRWFNVDVVVKDDKLKNFRYRATFEDEGLDEILVLLKLTAPIDYHIESRKQLKDGTFSKRKITLTLRNK